MKRAIIVFATVLWGSASPATASEYALTFTVAPNQTERFENGQRVVTDEAPGSTIQIISGGRSESKRGQLLVVVWNRSDAPINFGPENISIRLPDGSNSRMLTYEDLMQEQRKREARQRFAMAMSAMGRSLQASQAGYQYGTATYTGQSFGNVGGMPYSGSSFGTGTFSSYNPSAAHAAQSQANAANVQEIAAMKNAQAIARAQIGGVMQITTVAPAQSFGGVVNYDVPKAATKAKDGIPVSLEIRSGNDYHVFQGVISKTK